MDQLIEKLLHLLAWFGIGIIVLFVVGIWLFYLLKQDAERRDQLEEESKRKVPENSGSNSEPVEKG